MDGMIQDLLDSAKFQTGERLRLRLEEFDIQEVVKEVHDQFTLTHGPRLQVIGATIRGWWDQRGNQKGN